MKGKFSSMGRVAIALVLALSLGLVMAVPVSAATITTVTPTDIVVGPAYTALTGPVLAEDVAAEFTAGPGTIILTAPTGFAFDTGSSVTATVTVGDLQLTGGAAFETVTPTASTITITVTAVSTAASTITYTGVRIKDSDDTSGSTGSLEFSGTALVTGSAGTLTSIPGPVAQLAFTVEPGTVTAGAETTKFTVQRQDQYANPITSGTTVVGLASDSTGTAKEFRATAGGPAVVEVTIADAASTADFYYYDEKAGDWTITASATGLDSAESLLTVDPTTLAAYTVVPDGLTQTAGTPFSVVITAVDQFENPLGADYINPGEAYTWETNAGGTPEINEPLEFVNFGGVGVATKSVTLDFIETGVTFTVIDSDLIDGISEAVEVVAGPEAYLKVTGDPTMTAGETNELTVTACDAAGNVATSYTGSKTLVFSGLGVAPDATAPTVEGVTMENETTVTFTAGVSVLGSATLIAYLAEGPIEVDVTDGTIDSTDDAAYDLDLTVDSAAAAQLAYTAEPATVVAGDETGIFTVQRRDQYANPVTSGVTVVGLASDSTGAAKVFKAAPGGDAVTEVTIADAASTINFYYDDEKAGDWTITASATGLVSAESALTVGPAGIDHYAVSAIASPQVIGATFPVIIQAQDVFNNDITSGADELVNLSVGKTDAGLDPIQTTTTVDGTITVDVSLTVTTLGQSITFTGNVSSKTGTSNPFQTVTYGAIDHYEIAAAVGPQTVNAPFDVIIQAKDAAGNDITLGADAAEAITITFGLLDAGATPTSDTTSAGTVTVSMTMTVAQAGQTITFTGTSGATATTTAFSVYDVIMPLPLDVWVLISTDRWINSTDSAWIDEPVLVYKAVGSVFSTEVTLADLKPVEALYVKMGSEGGDLGIIYSTDVQGISAKELVAGWNLISSAYSDPDNAQAVLAELQDVAGAGTGLTTVVSQDIYNQNTGNLYVDAGTWDNLELVDLNAFDGYWIRMNADKTFAVVPQP